MIALIDADTMCYASAAMAEGQTEQIAIWNVNNQLDSLLATWNIREYQLFVTGKHNFRNKIYPEYKANRLKQQRPTYLQACKEYLVNAFEASMSDGCEADDMIGIEQYKYLALNMESVIISIDKDLDMLEGLHYSPEIRKSGKTIKEARRYHVSPNDGLKFFYKQLLTGDTTDNIKGVSGIGKVKAEQLLGNCTGGEEEFLGVARDLYSCEEELELNAKCLWIWRKENDDVTERWKEFKHE